MSKMEQYIKNYNRLVKVKSDIEQILKESEEYDLIDEISTATNNDITLFKNVKQILKKSEKWDLISVIFNEI